MTASSKPHWNLTVMLGGPSAEREVSLRSGAAVAKALRAAGHQVTELDPQDEHWTLPAGTQAVFLALHGTYGEDGGVQRRLEGLGVPYTGCDAEASHLAFDKALAKERFLAAGVRTPRGMVLDASARAWPAGWHPPVVLKPVRQGSSVGLRFVDREEDFLPALAEALQHDTDVLMEERILGREATVGILEDRALPLVEVVPGDGGFTYQNKYTKGASQYFCPARFDEVQTPRLQAAGLAAFRAIGGRDYARVDVMLTPAGEPVVFEVNTLPGMTETSLLPKAAAAAGFSFASLCERMIELALRHRGQQPPPSR